MNSEGVYAKKTRGGKTSFERRRGSFIDRVSEAVPFEENKRNKKTEKDRKTNTKARQQIQKRIIELKSQGYAREEALKRLKTEFPASEFVGYFEAWVENMYKKDKKILDPYRGVIKTDGGFER